MPPTFADGPETSKFAKVFSLESFLLYGILITIVTCVIHCNIDCFHSKMAVNLSCDIDVDQSVGHIMILCPPVTNLRSTCIYFSFLVHGFWRAKYFHM